MENTEIDYTNHVEAQIKEIIDNRAWWTGSFEKIDKTVHHAEKLVCSVEGIDTFEFAQKLWDEITPESLKIMNDGYCRWETEVENQFAHQILTDPEVKVENYLLYERFMRLLSREIQLLDGTDFNSVIFIGSGPFPITAILFHRLTGKHVDCLELENKSAEISRRVLKKLNLQDAIKVHVGNGENFDLGCYDVVLAALLAKPKEKIMQNVLNSGKPECKVLCRTSEGLRRILYESTRNLAYKGFTTHKMQHASYDDTISTVFLTPETIPVKELEFIWLEDITDGEIAGLVRFYNRIIAEDNNNGFTSQMTPADYYFCQLRNDLKAGLKRLMVIKDHQHYYGQFVVNLFHQNTYLHRGEVSSLMLNKSVRSGDVSLQIADQLIKECERLNLTLVTIDVREGSTQEKLWKYLGFTPYGTLPNYSRVGDQSFSGVFMFQKTSQMKVLLKRRLEAIYVNNRTL